MGNTSPLRVLCVIANPSDLSRFDDASSWQEIVNALQPLVSNGSVMLERLAEPTDGGLKRSLAQGQWHAVHFLAHGQSRSAANYGTIAVLSSEGKARNLTAAYLAGLIAGTASVKLVVLQACDRNSSFEVVADAVTAQSTAAVVIASQLAGKIRQIFVSKLYAATLAGLGAGALEAELKVAMGDDSVRVVARDAASPIMAAAAPGTAKPPVVAAPVAPAFQAQEQQVPALAESVQQQELKRKRALSQFDVFLCHNSADKPAVKRIAELLKQAGVLPWLDVWELPPGQPWQPLLEQQIDNIKAAAVFVGSAGLGPWQEQEMYGFLEEFVKRKVPVIPVLLSDAPAAPKLPIFLRAMTWVDFRADDPDPMEQLVWGITGRRPGE